MCGLTKLKIFYLGQKYIIGDTTFTRWLQWIWNEHESSTTPQLDAGTDGDSAESFIEMISKQTEW